MLDLMKLYGKKYRVTMDESWDAETTENRKEFTDKGEKPWYYEIVGKRGTLYMQKENACALELSPKLSKKLGGQYQTLRNCSEGPTKLIEQIDLEAIVKWILPRKRRILNPEHMAKLQAGARATQFRSEKNGTQNI